MNDNSKEEIAKLKEAVNIEDVIGAYSGASPFSIPEVHSAPKSGKLAPF